MTSCGFPARSHALSRRVVSVASIQPRLSRTVPCLISPRGVGGIDAKFSKVHTLVRGSFTDINDIRSIRTMGCAHSQPLSEPLCPASQYAAPQCVAPTPLRRPPIAIFAVLPRELAALALLWCDAKSLIASGAASHALHDLASRSAFYLLANTVTCRSLEFYRFVQG